jgi:anti-sigma B factor antagonist
MTRLSPLKAVASDTIADGSHVLTLDGEFDFAAAPQVEFELAEAIRHGTPVIVDLRGVTFLDSTMLHLIVTAHDRAKALNRRLCLVKPNPLIWRTFVLTGLDQRMSAFATLRQATAGPSAAA